MMLPKGVRKRHVRKREGERGGKRWNGEEKMRVMGDEREGGDIYAGRCSW